MFKVILDYLGSSELPDYIIIIPCLKNSRHTCRDTYTPARHGSTPHHCETQETESEGSPIQGLPQRHKNFETSQGYMSLKRKRKKSPFGQVHSHYPRGYVYVCAIFYYAAITPERMCYLLLCSKLCQSSILKKKGGGCVEWGLYAAQGRHLSCTLKASSSIPTWQR